MWTSVGVIWKRGPWTCTCPVPGGGHLRPGSHLRGAVRCGLSGSPGAGCAPRGCCTGRCWSWRRARRLRPPPLWLRRPRRPRTGNVFTAQSPFPVLHQAQQVRWRPFLWPIFFSLVQSLPWRKATTTRCRVFTGLWKYRSLKNCFTWIPALPSKSMINDCSSVYIYSFPETEMFCLWCADSRSNQGSLMTFHCFPVGNQCLVLSCTNGEEQSLWWRLWTRGFEAAHSSNILVDYNTGVKENKNLYSSSCVAFFIS